MSEATGLAMDPQAVRQTVSYIGGIEARQFPRSGMLTTVSFNSVTEFQTLQAAEYFIHRLPVVLRSSSNPSLLLASVDTLGTSQVETATAAGTATGDGNVTVVVASAILDATQTIQVPVLLGDTASAWAAKVRTALLKNGSIGTKYDVSGTGASIILTARKPAANDGTLNISLANGTPSPGITVAATSANTTAGVANTYATTTTIYDAFPAVSASQVGVSVRLSVSVTGRTSAP